MNDDERYAAWRESRKTVEVPDDFADRVMTSIHEGRRWQGQTLARALFVAVLASRIGRVAICFAVAAACFVRVVHVFSIFSAFAAQ